MRDKKHKNTPQWYIQNRLEPLKTGLERAKRALKTCFLAVKSRFLACKNYELATKLERQNGAKCSFCSEKRTKHKARKPRNCANLPTLRPKFSLERRENLCHFVKYNVIF